MLIYLIIIMKLVFIVKVYWLLNGLGYYLCYVVQFY